MVGLPDGEKNFEDMYNRLHTIPACDGQTDRHISCHGIIIIIIIISTTMFMVRYAYASCSKKVYRGVHYKQNMLHFSVFLQKHLAVINEISTDAWQSGICV